MDDNSQEVPDNSENSEQLAIMDENAENVPPKRRGRPAGSKDKAPRRTKTVIIETREPSPPREVAKPAPSQPAQAAQADPPSPRTLFARASAHMTQLHLERESARRAYWQDTISKSLR